MKKFLKKKIKNFLGITKLEEINEKNIFLNGKNLITNNLINFPDEIEKHEVKIFSQSGEDGIIQFILSKIKSKNKSFVEFGCENYLESNTRYLLFNNNWKGLIIDADIENINEIQESYYFWKHELTAISSFITKENIKEIICKYGFEKNLGILSIDIDGNDYWILKELIDIAPDVIICEYNSLLGSQKSLTIKYDENFLRENYSTNKINYGASIQAIHKILKNQYFLVYGNSFGNNVFYVNKKYQGLIKEKTTQECYKEITFNELTHLKNSPNEFEKKKKLIDLSKFEDV
tara:strand:+ start:2727 stop:3596 length:870 start_codon:yes stop_codon:yes gene_type:complete